MSTTVAEFEQLMRRVRAGCPEAARELFERYGDSVRRVVRARLHQRLRSQYDSADFTQSVWKSFFRIQADRIAFNTPEELVAFLSAIAHNKVIDVFRSRLQAGKRDCSRELPFAFHFGDEKEEPPAARQPTPSQEAIAQEHWERLVEGQPEVVRRALEMLREGHSHREVARCLGVTPKMITRLLQSLSWKMGSP
jgi:RNA polymerase sigma factor (sigma-70 family)